jgi:hypothetical protein
MFMCGNRWGRRKEFEKKSRLPNLAGKKSGLKIGLKKGRIGFIRK